MLILIAFGTASARAADIASGTATVDGSVEAAWSGATAYSITNVAGTVSSTSDLSGTWKGLWNSTHLFVLVEVTDDTKRNDSTNPWQDDAAELFVDGGNENASSYDTNDAQYILGWGDSAVIAGSNTSSGKLTGVTFATSNPSTTSYRIEVRVPWASLGVTQASNDQIGIDVHLDDDDNGGNRDGKKMWNDTTDTAWTNPGVFGTATLREPIPAVPTGLAANAGDAQVVLNWTASTGATSYNVKRSTTSGSGYGTVGTSTDTLHTDSSLTNGTTYYYVVSAVNSGGESANSSQASARPNAPAEVAGGTATVDGSMETAWANATAYAIPNIAGTVSGTSDLSGTWKGLWDASNFYVLAEIADDTKLNDSTNPWQDDAVELFVDGGNEKAAAYDTNDAQYVLGWGDSTVIGGTNTSGTKLTGVTFATSNPSSTSYRIEAKVPWAALGVTPVTGWDIGIDVHVDDDDDGGNRDGKRMWNDISDTAWSNPGRFGTGILQEPAPAAPTNLVATAGDNVVVLGWTASTGATSYNVKRSTTSGSGYSTIDTSTDTSHTDETAANGTTYYYVVSAVNSNGESANSAQVSATPEASSSVGTITIPAASSAPGIDGSVDGVWSGALSQSLDKTTGTVSGSSDASGSFKALWDGFNLYVLVDVTDDDKQNDSTDPWADDSVELYLDGGNEKATSYDANDRQVIYGWDDAAPTEGDDRDITGVIFAKADPTSTTYRIETRVPWGALGVMPLSGSSIGIDVHINDDDAGGLREGKKAWNDDTDQTWNNPSLFGIGDLTGTPGGSYQAEDGAMSADSVVDTQHAGYTGTGFVDFGASGSYVEWTNVNRSSSGTADLTFRYANGSTVNRTSSVIVNGVTAGTLDFAPSGGWAVWTTATVVGVSLDAGDNTVRVQASTSNGGPNLDKMDVSSSSAPPQQVATPSFSPTPGSYSSAQSVTLTTTTSGASIRYTTDGSNPTSTSGTLYTGPVSVTSTTTLKAIAYKSGMTDSTVASGSYTIGSPPTTNTNYFGLNTWFLTDYSGAREFADAFKQARVFEKPAGGAAGVDSNGWPTEDFKVVMWHGIGRMNGTYRMTFNGQADVLASWSSVSITNKTYNSSTNTTTATLTNSSTGTSGLLLTFTNTRRTGGSALGTGLTNIKLMKPTTEGGSTPYADDVLFTTQVKNVLGLGHVIRFMDWIHTNGNRTKDWADRTLPSYARQTRDFDGERAGLAWEYVVLLANDLDRDIWINVPVFATDDYVTKLAQLLRYGSNGVNPYTSVQSNPVFPPLDSHLKIYVEYSNELWNTASGFDQSHQNYDLAGAEVAAGGSVLNWDGETNTWYWAWRRVAKRTVDISNIFRSVWGDAQMNNETGQVRITLNAQKGYPDGPGQQALGLLEDWYATRAPTPRRPNYYVWGYGGSAYMDASDTSSVDALFNTMPNGTTSFEREVDWAMGFGMRRVAYEGGPSLPNNSVGNAAWSDPRMRTEVVDNHNGLWTSKGGDLLVYYVAVATSPEWSFTRDSFDINTPKLNALRDLDGATRSAQAYGVVVPATISAGSYVRPASYYNGAPSSLSEREWFIYTIRSTTTRNYTIWANTSASNSTSKLEFIVDGQSAGIVNVPNGTSQNTNGITVSLPAGIHGLMIKHNAGSFGVNSISIQ